MEAIENRLIELTRAVFYLIDPRDYRDPDSIIDELERQGFGKVSYEFVNAIYYQSMNEAEKCMKPMREATIRSLYYTSTQREFYLSATLWFERYLVFSYDYGSDQTSRKLEIFDPYNA
jgi:hypothetical protein